LLFGPVAGSRRAQAPASGVTCRLVGGAARACAADDGGQAMAHARWASGPR